MGVPEVLYPAPKKILTSSIHAPIGEESEIDLSENHHQHQGIIDRIKADLAEGLISPSEAAEAIESILSCTTLNSNSNSQEL